MTHKQQVDDAHAILLTVVNQAMARGLFNNIEDMPKVLDAIKLNQRLYDELTQLHLVADDLKQRLPSMTLTDHVE